MATPTKEQYAAAAAAIQARMQAEIKKDIPAMFQSRIPAEMIANFSVELAKAALDAAAASVATN